MSDRPSATARLLAGTALLLCTGTPSALAGEVTVGVGTSYGKPALTVTGSETADALDAEVDSAYVILTARADTTLAVGAVDHPSRCTTVATGLKCSTSNLGAVTGTAVSVAPVQARLLGGDDTFTVTKGSSAASAALDVEGGEGNDRLTGDREPDKFDGGPGHDALYGAGNTDYLTGGDGNDFVHLAPNLEGTGWSSPSDADDPASSCGAGTDMMLRDQTQDVDVLNAGHGCELDIGDVGYGDRSRFTATASGLQGYWQVGDTLQTTYRFTRSPATEVRTVWTACPPEASSTAGCPQIGSGSSFTFTPAQVGLEVRATATPVWAVPDNPVAWTGSAESTWGQRVHARQIPATPIPSTPAPPSPTGIRDALLAGLVPGKSAVRLGKKTSLALPTIDTRGMPSNVVVTLTVLPKALGRTGKAPVTIARGQVRSTAVVAPTLAANATGKALAKRLGAKRTVKGTLRVWVQTGTKGPSGSKTYTVSVRR